METLKSKRQDRVVWGKRYDNPIFLVDVRNPVVLHSYPAWKDSQKIKVAVMSE